MQERFCLINTVYSHNSKHTKAYSARVDEFGLPEGPVLQGNNCIILQEEHTVEMLMWSSIRVIKDAKRLQDNLNRDG